MIDFPNYLSHWTVDEVAECLNVKPETYSKLWSFVGKIEDNPLSEYDGETPPEPDHPSRVVAGIKKYWTKLTEEEQQDIVNAVKKELDYLDCLRDKKK